MNTNRLKLVWENGVSLSEAFAHFADDNAIRFKDHTKGLDPKFRGTKAENVEQVFKAVGALSNIMLDIASVKTKQREWLFIELDKKRLMAIGYKSSDSGTIEISIVPEPLLNPAFVDWEQSAISSALSLSMSESIFTENSIYLKMSQNRLDGHPEKSGYGKL